MKTITLLIALVCLFACATASASADLSRAYSCCVTRNIDSYRCAGVQCGSTPDTFYNPNRLWSDSPVEMPTRRSIRRINRRIPRRSVKNPRRTVEAEAMSEGVICAGPYCYIDGDVYTSF